MVGVGLGGGVRVVTWDLVVTQGVAIFKLVDFVFQVSDLSLKLVNGTICTFFDILKLIVLMKDFIIHILKRIVKVHDFQHEHHQQNL